MSPRRRSVVTAGYAARGRVVSRCAEREFLGAGARGVVGAEPCSRGAQVIVDARPIISRPVSEMTCVLGNGTGPREYSGETENSRSLVSGPCI